MPARRSSIASLCLLAALVVSMTGASPTPARAEGHTRERQVERIEAHVSEGLRANRVPGAALAVVDHGGDVHLRGFGVTGRGDAVTPDTPFVIGSVSKSMTALAVLQLVEDGLVGLDDPIAHHLDGFEVRPSAWAQLITVRRLLEQTSGLPPLAGGPATTWMLDVPIAEAARYVNGTELVSEPGTMWQYTNANYVLLGALIEEVTGRPYADHLRERLFGPLGMTRTTARLEAARALGLADGHRYILGVPVANLSYHEGLVPSGLVVSTAHDLGRYLQALLQGGELHGTRVLSAAGVDALFAPAAAATLGPWAKQPDASYGFGWFVGGTPFGPAPVVFHPGATPDFGATAALDPSEDSALILLVNVGPRVAVPGAAGDIDRIGAGAVSLLTGSEPMTAGSVIDAYRIATPVMVLVTLLALALAVRRPVPARRTRQLTTIAVTCAGLVLLALPTLGLGWRQNWLWAPDLTGFAGLAGSAFTVSGARGLLALRRQPRVTDAPTSTPTRPISPDARPLLRPGRG